MLRDRYSIFFRRIVDWRSFDIGIVEKLLCLNLFLGLISSILNLELIKGVNDFIVLISCFYFIVAPVFIYYRNFKTNNAYYIFITPIKKSYVFLTSLKTIFVGFLIFIVIRVLVVFMVIGTKSFIQNINLSYVFLSLLNFFIIIISIQMILVSTNIIANIKNAYKTIIYLIGGIFIFSKTFLPKFLLYKTFTNIDAIEFFTKPEGMIRDNIFWSEVTIEFGSSIIMFMGAVIIFIFAMKNFEDYSCETK